MPVTTRSASKRAVAKVTSPATNGTKKISKPTSTRTKRPGQGKAKATSAILKPIQDGLSPKQPVPVVRMAMTEADAQDEYMPGSLAFAAKFPQIVKRPLYAAIEDRYANLMLERIRRMENGFRRTPEQHRIQEGAWHVSDCFITALKDDMREKSGAEREARNEEITWIFEHSRRGEIDEKYYSPIPGKPRR
ncbi:hypothetical protein LTR56_011416 [Elasticomyces elasticus]|nr:hypothetical protein LTR56_011416 [Elasticomyces elasticus]KAK3655990.1 hypothetical protein LTR22_009999 [Elasticomyces elasticus]KAK4921489.1 hypothetical protein LTR49_011143 [Elasticomyces elasticus]KAK5760040.1 hypothetical protein LTS12_009771 [Elasticomyces elasticus]